MAHCRFENTYADLKDCYDDLSECGSIQEKEETSNQYERNYIKKLVALCKQIADDFGEELINQ